MEYEDLPVGTYTFLVWAVDRDLVYSTPPVAVGITINPLFADLGLASKVGLALVGLLAISGWAVKKRRALFVEMEQELKMAHDLQMGLMPTQRPQLAGFDLAGQCRPAHHVGGDFYQYFSKQGSLSVVLADVTGHAMEAAIPVVMFSGLLESQMESGGFMEDLFGRLNRSLYRALDKYTYVSFAMGELTPGTRALRSLSCGCPYPLHFQAERGEVVVLAMSAYPLGIRPEATYQALEIPLDPGDRVVFCSDGMVEAGNAAGGLFGFERMAEAVRSGCLEGLPASGLVEAALRRGECLCRRGAAGRRPDGGGATGREWVRLPWRRTAGIG